MENNKEIEELSTVDALDLVHSQYTKVMNENAELTDKLKFYQEQEQFTRTDFEKLSYQERNQLYHENKELYEKMTNPNPKWRNWIRNIWEKYREEYTSLYFYVFN